MAEILTCNTHSKHSIVTGAEKLVAVIAKYRWIIDAYVSDFYSLHLWEQLPKSLQEYFDHVEPSELAWILATRGKDQTPHVGSRPAPMSLLALKCCIQALSLRRSAVDLEKPDSRANISSSLHVKQETSHVLSCLPHLQEPHISHQTESVSAVETSAMQAPKYKNGQCMDMKHIFRKHVKPKKQHEIDRLGQVIKLLCHKSSCCSVVDVGAGLGHLSRLLTFQHGLRVTTVEAADGHAPKAAAFDRELKKDVHKATVKQKKSLSESSLFSSSLNLGQAYAPVQPDRKEIPCLSSAHLQSENTSNDSAMAIYNEALLGSEHSKNSSAVVDFSDHEKSKMKSEASHKPLNSGRTSLSPDKDESLPNHVICTVQPDIAASQFLDVLRHQTGGGTEHDTSNNFVLVGLHACGDLTPTILRVFVNCPTAVGLASVACCYMKISQRISDSSLNEDRLTNYPMSTCLKNLPGHELSYEAREMACHFADAYILRLKENSPHLKIHSYRAALQLLVLSVNPDFKSGDVKLVSKKGAHESFLSYAEENLKKVNIAITTVPQGLLEHCDNLTQHWKRVVAFYTLRLSLAPLVETLLLLDRALFLLENGIQSSLVPIFDCSISPRNFALLAVKG